MKRLLHNRTVGRRNWDFWRPIVAAFMTAIVVGAGQFTWNSFEAAAADRNWRAYISTYWYKCK